MLPVLPAIQELIQVMRSDLSDRMHSDMAASMDVPCENHLSNPGNVCIPNSDSMLQACNTFAGETHGMLTEANLPDVIQDSIFYPSKTRPDIVRSGLHEVPASTVYSTGPSEAPAIQPPKPTYTVLTSKNNLRPELSNPMMESTSPSQSQKTSLDRTCIVIIPNNILPRPDLSNTGPNSTMNSNRSPEIHQTPPKTTHIVPASNIQIPSSRSNPTPISTAPINPSKQPVIPPAWINSRFQKILPNPMLNVKIVNADTDSSPTMLQPNPTTPILYQVLIPNTPLTTFASIPSTPQQTSPNTIHVVPTSNRVTINSPATHNPNLKSSLLYQLLKPSVVSTACNIMPSEMSVSREPASMTEVSKTSCAVTEKDNIPPTTLQATFPNSGLSTVQNTNHSDTNSYPSFLRLHQDLSQPVLTVPNRPQNSFRTELQNITSVTNASEMANKSSLKQGRLESTCDGGLSNVKVELAREKLWKLFHDQGNEMIVVKQGRQMFPAIDLIASGLRTEEMYSISVRFVLVDEYHYNFNTSLEVWEPVCEDRYQPGPSRCFEHSASPASGQNWNEKLVTFNELRLTNRATKSKNLVYTPTMRKHRVQLVVTILRCPSCHSEHTRHIDIPLTEFIAVSSYYSLKTKQLKITYNPMAKTKCLNGQHKRKSGSPEEVPSCHTKKQKTTEEPSSEISEANPSLLALLSQPVNSSESTRNKYLFTMTNSQLSSTIQSTSNSQLTIISPSVLQSTSSFLKIPLSTSRSPLPQVKISSTSCTKPAEPLPSSSTTTITCSQQPRIDPQIIPRNNSAAKDQCSTVYTCQTTKPSAHVQTDDDILDYIKVYLSPFLTSEKSEAFDSSVFDELLNINFIPDKWDNFENIVY